MQNASRSEIVVLRVRRGPRMGARLFFQRVPAGPACGESLFLGPANRSRLYRWVKTPSVPRFRAEGAACLTDTRFSIAPSGEWPPGGPSLKSRQSLKPLIKASALISSTRDSLAPQYSPDGKRVAFMSIRSGSEEIWICDSDGANLIQLTSLGGPSVTTPRWSPDGTKIAFDSTAAGEYDIWVVGAN